MGSQFTLENKGGGTLYVHAMSRDADGRFTHAYLIEVASGVTKTFSSQTGSAFMVHETPPAHGVLLPRGVTPVDVEKPDDVPVDKATAREARRVSEQPAA